MAQTIDINTMDDVLCSQVKKSNSDLKQLRLCKICLTSDVKIVFLPCGHLVTCEKCSYKIINCCICRTFIRGTVKTFMD